MKKAVQFAFFYGVFYDFYDFWFLVSKPSQLVF